MCVSVTSAFTDVPMGTPPLPSSTVFPVSGAPSRATGTTSPSPITGDSICVRLCAGRGFWSHRRGSSPSCRRVAHICACFQKVFDILDAILEMGNAVLFLEQVAVLGMSVEVREK